MKEEETKGKEIKKILGGFPFTPGGEAVLDEILENNLPFFGLYERIFLIIKAWLIVVEIEGLLGMKSKNFSPRGKMVILKAMENLAEKVIKSPYYNNEVKTYYDYLPFFNSFLASMRRVDPQEENTAFSLRIGNAIIEAIRSLKGGNFFRMNPEEIRKEILRGFNNILTKGEDEGLKKKSADVFSLENED